MCDLVWPKKISFAEKNKTKNYNKSRIAYVDLSVGKSIKGIECGQSHYLKDGRWLFNFINEAVSWDG